MTTKILRTVIFLFLCASFLSCTKEVAGPKGDPGAQGQKGDPGQAGKDGNVASTGTLLVESSQWVVAEDSLEWSTSVSAPLISEAVVNGGAVEMFVYHDDAWHSLPFFDHSSFLAYSYAAGMVKLICSDSHGEKPSRPETATFRVVAIASVE